MTNPFERTESVLRTRKLLEQLSVSAAVPDDVRNEAARLLTHYPDELAIDRAALAWPAVWCATLLRPFGATPTYVEMLAELNDNVRLLNERKAWLEGDVQNMSDLDVMRLYGPGARKVPKPE